MTFKLRFYLEKERLNKVNIMEDKNKITCGSCGSRLLYHYKYKDINKNSRYSMCEYRPQLMQKNNISPKWCPKKL